ncbi:MAG: hypothetical protein FJ117_13805 [Deltaproteobacteria bacterium]|nr:hypothetical protein [Deltaproteobacteria bacterium]
MERAGSIGRVFAWPRRTPLVSAGGGGGAFSPPHPRRNQRLMIPIPPWRDQAPGPWIPSDFTPHLFSKG